MPVILFKKNWLTNFKSDIEIALDISIVERNYVDATTAEVAAAIFTHWNFDREFVQMIEYSDAPEKAPEEIKEYSTVLHIIKTIMPINNPLSERAITQGLKKAEAAGLNVPALQKAIDAISETIA